MRLIDAEPLEKSDNKQIADAVKVQPTVTSVIDVPRGTYQCFNCLSFSVIWDSDFDFEDFGYEGEGIVHICHCTNCGAQIEYDVPCDPPEDEEEAEDSKDE